MNGEEAFERGKEFYEQGEYSKAIECFENTLNDENYATPGNARNNMGIAYGNLGEHKKAIECFEKALEDENYATPGKALNNEGIAYGNLGEYEDAIDCFKKAFADKNFDRSMACNNTGFTYQNLEKYEKAIKYYEKAIRYNPKYANAHNNLGGTFYRLKRLTDAEEQFRKAIQIKPDFDEPHYNLGVILTDEEFYDDAKEEFEIALNLESTKPANADYLNGLGYVLWNLGDHKKAKEKFEEAISSDRTHSKAQYNLRTIKNTSVTKHWRPKSVWYTCIPYIIIFIVIGVCYLVRGEGDLVSGSDFVIFIIVSMSLLTVIALFPEYKYLKISTSGIEVVPRDVEGKPTLSPIGIPPSI